VVNDLLKFSIVTPSFNQGEYIEQNILSVIDQRVGSVEHIVIDGGSTDNTVEILKQYTHLIWRSEPDEGQTDALNKGLAIATGDIVGWINSDDYYRPGALSEVAKCFEDKSVQWVIGGVSLFFEDNNEFVSQQSAKVTLQRLMEDPNIVRQQATFFRREFLLNAAGWNKEFYMVMDFDLWIRLARKSEPLMIDRDWAVFRIQANQKSTLRNLARHTQELVQILRREKAPEYLVCRLQLIKRWHWLKAYIKSIGVRLGFVDKRFAFRSMRPYKNNNRS